MKTTPIFVYGYVWPEDTPFLKGLLVIGIVFAIYVFNFTL